MLCFQYDGQKLATPTLKLQLRFCILLVRIALLCQVWFASAAPLLELSLALHSSCLWKLRSPLSHPFAKCT